MRTRNRNGSALLLAIISFIVLAGIGAAFFSISLSRERVTTNATWRDSTLHIAEAGIDDTINMMNAYQATINAKSPPPSNADFAVLGTAVTDATGTKNVVTGTLNGGSYTVELRPAFAGVGTYMLVSTAVFGSTSRSLEVAVAPTNSSLFDYGAFGDVRVHMDSNSSNDGYDSDLGSYSSQAKSKLKGATYANTSGNTGSNGNITLDSNAAIFGNGTPGPSGTVTQKSNSFVTGSTAPAPSPKPLPQIELPPAAALAPQALALNSNSTQTIPSGQYHFSSLTTDSNSILTIKGPATLVVDTFSTNSNSNIIIDSTKGPVDIYGTGAFWLDSNSVVKSTNSKPSDLRIWITTDNYTGFAATESGNPDLPVELDSNTELFATVYAPNAILNLNSNGHLFGAVVGKKITENSNFRIHYDEALGRASIPGPYRARSWREINR